MKEREIYIKELVNKFFDGKTNNKEEEELLQFFSDEDIPCELNEYKDIFCYYGGELIEELKEEGQSFYVISGRKRIRNKAGIIALASVAAVLLILIIIPLVNRFDSYEGSYMVKNGERFYNSELIRQQEIEIMRMASARDKEYSQIYEQSVQKTNEIKDIMMVKK